MKRNRKIIIEIERLKAKIAELEKKLAGKNKNDTQIKSEGITR